MAFHFSLVSQGQIKNEINFENKVNIILQNNHFNGVILVSKDTSVLYEKAVGFSDLANNTPLNASDQFVIGSVSKQITAVMVLRAYERGLLKLEDKIFTYLPDLRQPWAKDITIHQLLTHTHGITALDQPLAFKEGSRFQYSQLGYELLAQILENTTGQTFNELSTELFERYGLRNTFHPDNKNYHHLVKGYEESTDGDLIFVSNSLENYAAAGAFISNANDLIKWNALLHHGQLVSINTLSLMKTRYATRIHPIFDQIEYGYGLLFKAGMEHLEIGAFGYAPGFATACYFYPKTGKSLIVLANAARDLDDFKKTFGVHTALMDLMEIESE